MATKTYSEKLRDPRWQKCRLRILERDNFTCQLCGNTETTLHVHHITYEKNPWETPEHLLKTLCADCHDGIELCRKNVKMYISEIESSDCAELIFECEYLLMRLYESSIDPPTLRLIGDMLGVFNIDDFENLKKQVNKKLGNGK